MPYLILVIGLLFGIYGLYRFFLNADVKEIKALGLAIFTGAVTIALIIMALTGRLGAALALFAAMMPFAAAYWRSRKESSQPPAPTFPDMTTSEALSVLGLEAGASKTEIQVAYKKLMVKVHPDSEGSDWMAAKLNQARDILLKD